MEGRMMDACHVQDLASEYSLRLDRQNRYLDLLETALEQGRTEEETRVVLALLKLTMQRLDRLEIEFLDSCRH
jgi:hypothetical protein